jgi:hypothetical protein
MRPDRRRLALFVFIDAFGWELLRRRPFLDDVLKVKAPLTTVLGYSSACDPTILTGRPPREHGHFSCFRYSPASSPFGACRFLDLLPGFITRRGRVRRVMSRVIQRCYGYTGYFQIYNVPFRYLPLFDYSEKRDIYQPGGINGGVPTVFDHLRDRGIPFYLSDWRQSEGDNLASLEAALEEGGVAFAYLYLAALDAVLHAHGTRSPAVEEKVRWYDDRLRWAVRLAQKNYDAVHLHLFSDHGMTDVTDCCDLIARIDRLGLRFGVDYAAIYDSTMARFWFLKDAARERIVEALRAEPRGEILSEGRLAGYGCDFADRGYGELFFLVNPGVLICPSFMGETPLAGMHGYEPHHRDSLAMFASNVVPDPMPRRLEDLHGLMLREVSS